MKKKCKKKDFQGIHDRFIRDPEFRNRMIEKIETKNFAENEMFLRMKMIPTIWSQKNTHSTRVTGGFIRTSKVPVLCERRTDLTSKRHCLPCSNWNKKKELCKRPRTLTEINNRHKVLSGGTGKVHDGFLIPMKVTMEMKPSTDRKGRLVVQYLE